MDRELMDWSSVWSKPDTLCMYIHCVMNAAYHETEYQGMTLKPGQFVTSAAKMAVECGLSEATVKRVFKRLESYHLIARQAIGKGTKSGTLITVANSAFQGDPNFNPDLQTSFDLADEHSAFVPLADPEALHYQRIRRKKENENNSGGGSNELPEEPPPPIFNNYDIPKSWKPYIEQLSQQYGEVIAQEAWKRACDNSSATNDKRTKAYLESVCKGIIEDRKAADRRTDEQGREIWN